MKMHGLALVTALLAAALLPAQAGIVVYEKDDKKAEIGGRIQINYVRIDPDCSAGVSCLENDSGDTFDESVDSLFFRRLRAYLAGTFNKNWMGKIQFDFGQSFNENEVQIKDAYFAYTGFKNDHSKLTIGNSKAVFAREFLNSSARLERVERGFAGDHNFGAPDWALGVRWNSRLMDGKLSYAVNLGAEYHDPSVNRIDFESPVNDSDDWNQGAVLAARLDFHPLGHLNFSQADFSRSKSKLTVGVSVFAWANDGDNNTYTGPTGNAMNPDKVDLDRASGYEVSGAYRGHGFSVDAEYQLVSGETVDPTFTGGIYRDGETDLQKLQVVGGYMAVKEFFEVVAGWDSMDADNYEKKFQRTSLGVNFYFKHQHKLKLQLQYQITENFLGIDGQDQNVIMASTLFRF